MAIKIDYITLGSFAVNTYFLIDEENKKAIIVDPGDSGVEIEEYVKEKGLTVEKIINTHGHPDHVEANSYLKNRFKAPLYMHFADSSLFRLRYDYEIKEGEEIEFGGEKIRVIETPGHTFGSVCLAGDGWVLTGDTLFAGAMGRTDLGGDMATMMNTLATKFDEFSDETILYPGHGPSTTMGEERRSNHYVLMAKAGQ